MKRLNSLDALRGLAILLMVLSGSIAFGGVLPAWMYHAQVPPPAHVFKPELPGITWVDLVFPFFLFAMGAAMPLALAKKAQTLPAWKLLWQIVQRYILLIFFAVFTMHARAWVMQTAPGVNENIISTACYLLLFMMYAYSRQWEGKWQVAVKAVGFILALSFLALYPFAGGFSLAKSDIIIVVLANMALFASLIWCLTRNRPMLRIGILPFIMAVFLTGKDAGTWNSALFNWSPFPWLYKFYYLKYLFIVLPATFAGEWLQQYSGADLQDKASSDKGKWGTIAALCWILLAGNLVCLYSRMLLTNLVISIGLSALVMYLLKLITPNEDKTLLTKLISTGIYLLLLGLFFEAYEGGIKKDYSTYSYYFVTTGLAFTTLASLHIMERMQWFTSLLNYWGDNGKNPMVAYTTGNLLLIPILKITGGNDLLDAMGATALGGLMRGVIFTGVVSLVTVYCTRQKVFWKT